MAHRAPETPTTQDLNALHLLPQPALEIVQANRAELSSLLRDHDGRLFAGVGACALTDNHAILDQEAAALQGLERFAPGLLTGQRLNTWKPRTNPDAWHGMESTREEVGPAHRIVTLQAVRYGNAIMELGYPEHVERYAVSGRTMFGWIGARADGSQGQKAARELLEAAAAVHDLPLGIKNGLDGDVAAAVRRAELVERMRGSEGAPAIVIYRGGENALTPQAWEDNYKRLWNLTGGKMIVDSAHGGAVAHDGGKTIAGQIAALDHITELTLEGYAPAGTLTEASGTPTVVDTNMPYDHALLAVTAIASIKAGMAQVNA